MARAAIARGRGIAHTRTDTHAPLLFGLRTVTSGGAEMHGERATILLESARALRAEGKEYLRRKKGSVFPVSRGSRDALTYYNTTMSLVRVRFRKGCAIFRLSSNGSASACCYRRRSKQKQFPRLTGRPTVRRTRRDVQAAHSTIVSERRHPISFSEHHP